MDSRIEARRVHMQEIEVVEEAPMLVAGMRKQGQYKEIAKMLPALFEYIVGSSARIAGPPMFLWHEKSVEEAHEADEAGRAEIEVVVPIAARIPETNQIKCYELPGGRMVKMVHKGPYESSVSTYEKLFAWIEENEKKLFGPIRESYLNDPKTVEPQEILTAIYAPIG